MAVPLTQKAVPRVREICDLLGFRTSSDRPQSHLTESTHSWRRCYTTEQGTGGKDLTEWKSRDIQKQLERMAIDYLEIGGHGERFWPTRGCPSPRLVPEYTKDKSRIVTLTSQLFWRQNTNEARNYTYYYGAKSEAKDTAHVDDTHARLESPSSAPEKSHKSRDGFPPPSLLNNFSASTKAPERENASYKDPQQQALRKQISSKSFLASTSMSGSLRQSKTQGKAKILSVKRSQKRLAPGIEFEFIDSEDEEEIQRNRQKLLVTFSCAPGDLHKLACEQRMNAPTAVMMPPLSKSRKRKQPDEEFAHEPNSHTKQSELAEEHRKGTLQTPPKQKRSKIVYEKESPQSKGKRMGRKGVRQYTEHTPDESNIQEDVEPIELLFTAGGTSWKDPDARDCDYTPPKARKRRDTDITDRESSDDDSNTRMATRSVGIHNQKAVKPTIRKARDSDAQVPPMQNASSEYPDRHKAQVNSNEDQQRQRQDPSSKSPLKSRKKDIAAVSTKGSEPREESCKPRKSAQDIILEIDRLRRELLRQGEQASPYKPLAISQPGHTGDELIQHASNIQPRLQKIPSPTQDNTQQKNDPIIPIQTSAGTHRSPTDAFLPPQRRSPSQSSLESAKRARISSTEKVEPSKIGASDVSMTPRSSSPVSQSGNPGHNNKTTLLPLQIPLNGDKGHHGRGIPDDNPSGSMLERRTHKDVDLTDKPLTITKDVLDESSNPLTGDTSAFLPTSSDTAAAQGIEGSESRALFGSTPRSESSALDHWPRSNTVHAPHANTSSNIKDAPNMQKEAKLIANLEQETPYHTFFRKNSQTPGSESASSHTRASSTTSDPQRTSQQAARIRFFIIKARHPRLIKRGWETGGLSDKTVDSLFSEISRLSGRQKVGQIAFKLVTAQADHEEVIERGNEGTFKTMCTDFKKEIRADMKKRNNYEFKIEVEPDPDADNAVAEDDDDGNSEAEVEL